MDPTSAWFGKVNLAIMLLTFGIGSVGGEGTSFCGNTQFDLPSSRDRSSDPSYQQQVPEIFRKKLFPPRDRQGIQAQQQRVQKLATTPFPVRLRVLFDAAFEEEFATRNDLETFVSNLFRATQMVYEQPEIRLMMKMYFVVVRLERMRKEFPIGFPSEDILNYAVEYQGQAANDEYDITFLLLYTHIFRADMSPKQNFLLGMSGLGTFCNHETTSQNLVFTAGSMNIGIIVAHEFAHSLNVLHDSTGSGVESSCKSQEFIMGPIKAPGRDKWSNCSVEVMKRYLTSDGIFDCVYNETRFNATPVSNLFDLSPSGMKIEPGQDVPADRQCRLATDKSIRGEIPLDQDICNRLRCPVDGNLVDIGAALPGTNCEVPQNRSLKGMCMHGDCAILP